MEDITLRALGTLAEVDLVAAEDTRHTRKLFTRHGISTPLISFHDHNKEKRTPDLLRQLEAGNAIALVTDAGTPSISDPGYYLVKKALQRTIAVVPIPGPSAAIAALSVSGLPSDSFVFLGFVPRKPGKRREFLEMLKWERRTLIFYESPKRLVGLVQTMFDVFGDRQAVLARELTKIHEEILRGGLMQITKDLDGRPSLKGECTLLVAGFEGKRDIDMATVRNYLRRLRRDKGGSLSKLAKEVAGEFGLPRQAVYEEALRIEQENTS
jgi:16S rRNA (cytidine1402-2'-O)-methyltransferase